MVFVRTSAAQRTVSLHVRLAGWAIRVEAEAVFASEEIAEAEAVGGLEPLFGGGRPLDLCRHGGGDGDSDASR